jgi:hypothetical protein
VLDSAENPHAAHGGSEVFSSNSCSRNFLDDVLVWAIPEKGTLKSIMPSLLAPNRKIGEAFA